MALAFADSIIPTGTQNGVNRTFTLPQAPNPTASLQLLLNGVMQDQGADYTLSGNVITYTGGAFPPQAGNVHLAWYRYASAPTAGLMELRDILVPALRIAGITQLPGTGPNSDTFGELIPMFNMFMSHYSLDGHRVFATIPTQYTLTGNQKIYTIGPGAQLNSPRPIQIQCANIIFPTSPQVRWPMRILETDEWASIGVQDIPGAPPAALYYDKNYDSNGYGQIYLYMQPPTGYTLELFSWLELPDSFVAVTDLFSAPPGYPAAMTWNFALWVAGLYPLEAKLMPTAPEIARQTLQAIITDNTKARKIGTEPGLGWPGNHSPTHPWLAGPFR